MNAGAIAVTDAFLGGRQPKAAIEEIVRFRRFPAGDSSIVVDAEVARSELPHGDRNAAPGHFMKSYGVINQPPAEVLDGYFHQGAMVMNWVQMARSDLFLASNGRNPLAGMRVDSAPRARRSNSLMMMGGHYDGAGDFAFRVGLRGKSGVGGGIIAIGPGKASIAVWSPGLDANGNSLVGTAALERLTTRLGWSVFG